jgi:hypothetical protein
VRAGGAGVVSVSPAAGAPGGIYAGPDAGGRSVLVQRMHLVQMWPRGSVQGGASPQLLSVLLLRSCIEYGISNLFLAMR